MYWNCFVLYYCRPFVCQLRKIREAREAVDARFAENAAQLMERQAEKQTSATRRHVAIPLNSSQPYTYLVIFYRRPFFFFFLLFFSFFYKELIMIDILLILYGVNTAVVPGLSSFLSLSLSLSSSGKLYVVKILVQHGIEESERAYVARTFFFSVLL